MQTDVEQAPPPDADMMRFLPPVNRTMRVLDRSFFKKTVSLSAARVFDPKQISRVRKECSADIFPTRKRLSAIVADPQPGSGSGKVILLRPDIKHDDLSTVGPVTAEFVRSKMIELLPYDIHLTYDDWDYAEIINAILPEELLDGAPVAFARAGHLAHLNLRNQYLPYKHLIATILLDKNPTIKTVVNKIEDVGKESVFRTFPMEVLAGPPDTMVETKESGCVFSFDFAKVYWNSRLSYEHERIIGKFAPGEAVADVMAGVGPFAIPAGKKGVIVWANDLNPESYVSLQHNIEKNKVFRFVFARNDDGRAFIRGAIINLYKLHLSPEFNPIVIKPPAVRRNTKQGEAEKDKKGGKKAVKPAPQEKMIPVPPAFAHFVMNLPASAITFLDAFIGCYRGLPQDLPLPMIHVYTFLLPQEVEVVRRELAELVSKYLHHDVREAEIEVHEVRLVAPNKCMYCVSFRLPAEVAWSEEQLPESIETVEERENRKDIDKWVAWPRGEKEKSTGKI